MAEEDKRGIFRSSTPLKTALKDIAFGNGQFQNNNIHMP